MTREEISRIRNLCQALEKEGPHRTLSHNITAHDLHIVLRAALAHANLRSAQLDLAMWGAAQNSNGKPTPAPTPVQKRVSARKKS